SDWWRRWAKRPRWLPAGGAVGALAIVAALALGRSRAEAARAAGAVATHPSDSAVATSPAPPPLMRITAPPNAVVTVDGKEVGHGNWTGTRFAAGQHRVVATLHSIAGCAWATDSAMARVPARGEVKVKLAPHPCGTVAVDAAPNGARWELTSLDGASVANGQIPQATPVVVPSGTYVLRVSKSYC